MEWLNNLRMKQKLIISFLAIGLLIAVVGIIGIRNMNEINSNQMLMYKEDLIGIRNISAVKSNLIQINANLHKILHEDNESSIQSLIGKIEELKEDDDRLLLQYKSTIRDEKDGLMYNEFTTILKEYRNYRSVFLDHVNRGQWENAKDIFEKSRSINEKIVIYAEGYIRFKENLARESYERNHFLYRQTYIINIAIAVFGLLLAANFAIKIASTISMELEKVLHFAEALSKGNLEHSIDIKSKDEIGELAMALNEAAAVRNEYEQKLACNYEELEASYEEITALEADLRDKYQDLESSYEEITALEQELREKYSELEASEETLRDNYEWYRLVTKASYDILWDWNIKDNSLVFSEKWHTIFGYENENVNVPKDWLKFIHREDINMVKSTLKEHWTNKSETFDIQYRVKTFEGNYLWVSGTGRTIYDEDGKPYRSAGCHRDVTETKNYQNKLEHMAYHDYLTDLPNRQYIYKRLNPSVSHGAVLFIDMDNFKYINDTMGHTFGDELITLVGKRITSFIGKENALIRLGGDEFVIYIQNIENKDSVEQFTKNLLTKLSKPFEILNNNVNITISVGIALFPENGEDIDELLKKADIAMYQSKYAGKNSYTFFIDNMNEEMSERMSIERLLRKALDNEEFTLHYQPQVEIESGKVSGFEALIRWNSPELGFISPVKFIPIAEENHMIIDIGKWVLKTASNFIMKVHEAGRRECYISVNVSILQLIQSDFTDDICKLLKETGLPPHLLELEITESVFIDSYEIIRINIEKLKSLGVRLALDDFGKGYSSLSYLKQLPINTLKTDKSFIDDINSEKNNSLVENIIMIGHKMNLEVVAEGVEMENQANYLKDYKCDKIQGYLYSKPIPSEVAIDQIKNNKF